MTRMNLLIGSVMAVWIATAGLAAQTAGTTPAKGSAAPTAKATTVTGCVERADQLTPGGTETTTVDSQHFVLIRAQPSSEKAPAAATPTATAGSLGPMYRLIVDAQKLNAHVGHKVEITGTVEPAAGAPPKSTDPSPATSPSLTVQSIKMLSETCGR
jgi:hypothetical protein